MEASGLGPPPTQPWPSGLRLTTCPGLGHRSLLGPPLPAWSLHDWAPPPPLWCSSRNFSAIPPTPTPVSTRSSSSSRGGWSLAPLGRVLTQEAWPGRTARQAHWNPPRAACWQATACCCQPDWLRGSKTAVQCAGAEWEKGGGGMQGAWPGERVMEEAESEEEEVRGARGAAGSAETMASGDGGRVEGDLQRALRRGS